MYLSKIVVSLVILLVHILWYWYRSIHGKLEYLRCVGIDCSVIHLSSGAHTFLTFSQFIPNYLNETLGFLSTIAAIVSGHILFAGLYHFISPQRWKNRIDLLKSFIKLVILFFVQLTFAIWPISLALFLIYYWYLLRFFTSLVVYLFMRNAKN